MPGRSAQAFDFAPPFFLLQAAGFCGGRWPGPLAFLRADHRPADEGDEFVDRILAVLGLRSVALGLDDQDPLRSQAGTSEVGQSLPDLSWKRSVVF